MNRDEIINMQPGRELDEAVAKHVMGKENNKTMWGQKVFSPSTDISAAWEVVEKLQTKWEVNIYNRSGWTVRLSTNLSLGYNFEAIGDTAPEAICKAALLSLIQEDTPND